MTHLILSPVIGELIRAASDYRRRGLKPLPLDGKNPSVKKWQHVDPDDGTIRRRLVAASEPGIGVRMGQSSGVADIEWDTAAQRAKAHEIFGDVLDNCPAFGRANDPNHEHRIIAWHDDLDATGKGNLYIPCDDGSKLIIRLGAAGKGSQSAFPPSPAKVWLPGRSLDDCSPPAIPAGAIQYLVALAVPKKHKPANGHVVDTALAAMLRIKPKDSEHDGTSRLFAVACRAIGHNLADDVALATIREYERQNPFPRDWSDSQIIQRIRDAEDKVAKGSEVSFAPTDIGNAERFANQHGDDVRYCHVWGKWLVWDGRRWPIDTTGETTRRAKRTARSIYGEAASCEDDLIRKSLGKWARASESNKMLSNMIALARSEQPIPIAVESLDAEPWLLNCEDGTIDLRTGELRDHRREDYMTKMAPVKWSDDSPTLWLAFLSQIFDGNQELIGFVKRLMGASLVGEVSEHVLPIFWGSGANGKSTLLETWRGMLGNDYASSAPPGFLISVKSRQHPTELADLHGKRFVAAEETDDSGRLSESLVKALTGGNSIRARRMREDFWQFQPSHSIVLATNHRPVVRGTDYGIWRRLLLVPFNVTIPPEQQDKRLATKLRAEWPAILRWAVQGCLEWQQSGLRPPTEVMAATDSYRVDMDTLAQFIDECCTAGGKVKASDLYDSYKHWSQLRGDDVLSSTKFGTRMTDKHEKRKSNAGWSYVGISLI
jgi:putative DNA primase/helicase